MLNPDYRKGEFWSELQYVQRELPTVSDPAFLIQNMSFVELASGTYAKMPRLATSDL